MITEAIRATGQETNGALVLFGPNAALPHGSGTDRTLGIHDLILIDAGGSLHGYFSDITRTFALKDSLIRAVDLVAWYVVHEAQKAAHDTAKEGVRAMEVDRAARLVIELARYGPSFTHRLGHGKQIHLNKLLCLSEVSKELDLKDMKAHI
jgi:Xaa-Pro aminopeptidase